MTEQQKTTDPKQNEAGEKPQTSAAQPKPVVPACGTTTSATTLQRPHWKGY